MFDSRGELEEIKEAVLNEIYELDDMLVHEVPGERKARLSGKKEAYEHVFKLISEYD